MNIEDIKGLGHIKVSHLNSGVVKITTEDGYWLLSGHTFSKELYARVDSTFLDYTIVTSEEKNKAENSSKYEGKTLEEAKETCLNEIEEYDVSPSVNGFYLNDTLIPWSSDDGSTLNKDVRMGLRQNIKDKISLGEENIDMWLDGMKITLPCEKADAFMCNLENYAYECFNVTAAHKKAVEDMVSVEEVEAFDVTADYPKQLEMKL